MKKKQITLHKSNEMTRGADGLSVYGKRLVNAIYYLIQNNANESEAKKQMLEQMEYIPLEFPYLRKMLGLEKVESYIKEIEKAFDELHKPIELNNFRNPRDNRLYNWYSISMISEASYVIDAYKKTAYVALAPLVKWLMIHTHDKELKGNFTRLELIPTINKLRTKYSMKLYEYLASFGAFRYLDITQKHLMRLFGIDENNKTYKNYSDLKRLLERQLNEIKEKTNLTEVRLLDSKLLAKDKTFRVIINPKSKRDVGKMEAKTALDSLLEKIRF